MAIETLAATTMLTALDNVATTIELFCQGDSSAHDSKSVAFTVSGASMSLTSNIVFDVSAGKIVSHIKVNTATPQLLFLATLSGTEAERTYTYAGTYTLTACTVTLS